MSVVAGRMTRMTTPAAVIMDAAAYAQAVEDAVKASAAYYGAWIRRWLRCGTCCRLLATGGYGVCTDCLRRDAADVRPLRT
ncbi:hypothetical protein E4U91_35785 [Streptomyces lasalocidi]|uniref:Uncharacterized protein n=1 Tax=Streptomyces lasalocidi TaxID=324833 RepID=A0A4V6AUI5_STRLS|nr:hypothetical protein E4U91_35785 [Streptomyces lasalocidi]